MHTWLPLLSLVLLASCGGGKDWRKAKREGTADAYRAVANQFDHPKREVAAKRAESLDWKEAEKEGSSKAWKAYISHHPSSPRVDEARKRRDDARWEEVKKADSRTTYESWLAMNGASAHAAEARQRIEALAWQEAETAGDDEAYARYLVRYPNGSHARDADQRRQDLWWGKITYEDKPSGYREYLDKHPNGVHSEEARKVLDGFRFSGIAVRVVGRRLRRKDSLKTYEEQLKGSLLEVLKASGFAVEWMPAVDGSGATAQNPLAELLTTVPEDHAALVIEVRENRGQSVGSAGYATDIEATVHLVPPARSEAMDVRQVRASTTPASKPGEAAMHLDAQKELGEAILAAGFGFESWQR